MLRILKTAVLAFVWAGWIGLRSLPALEPEQPGGFDETTLAQDQQKPERKLPGFFHRPTKSTPAEQLAYARSLEAAGRIRAAMKQYVAIVHQWHASLEAPIAQEAYARLLAEREKYEQAFSEYQYLFDFFAGTFDSPRILKEQFKIANAVCAERHGGLFLFKGVTTPERALPMFGKIVANAPQWDRAAEAQFMVGSIHEEGKDYSLAASAYEAVQLRYPSSPAAGDAAFGRAGCLCFLARKTPRDEEGLRNAISAISVFVRDFPANPAVETARGYLGEMKNRLEKLSYDRAVFYDRAARRPEAALIAYREFMGLFPCSERRKEVEERMAYLQRQLEDRNEK
jgi:tetratricopeptide (TPR) repeat protein